MAKRAKSIYKKRIWPKKDEKFLEENYNTMSMPELMEQLSRTDLAIHKRAGLLGITGKRYNINNYAVGASYKIKTNKKPLRKIKKGEAKKINVTMAYSRKRKPKRQRWCDKQFDVKPFDAKGKVLVRVDQRTSIYVPETATQSEIETIINRFKNVP